MSEFVVSLACMLSFNAAGKGNLNQGLGTSIMICNCLMVTLLSFCFMGEKVTCAQISGIVAIVVAVIIISTFKADIAESTDINTVTASDTAKYTTLTVIWGLIGAVFCSLEIMCNKWLMIKRSVNGDISGIAFLFVEGIIGSVCLLVTSLQGDGVHLLDMKAHFLMAIAGACGFSALVILNYAISIGLAGVTISIFNLNAVVHVLLSSIFLHQIISNLQIAGVVIAVVGACMLSMGDMLIEKCRSKGK